MDYLMLPGVDEMPAFQVQRFRTPKSKIEDEVLVCFDSPDTRDYVKAASGNLSGHGGKAGIRIHVLVHLKANFRHLDAVCFQLKQKFPALKQSVKYDDDAIDLVADVKTSDEAPWQRITPADARQAKTKAPPSQSSSGPTHLSADAISDLLRDENMTS